MGPAGPGGPAYAEGGPGGSAFSLAKEGYIKGGAGGNAEAHGGHGGVGGSCCSPTSSGLGGAGGKGNDAIARGGQAGVTSPAGRPGNLETGGDAKAFGGDGGAGGGGWVSKGAGGDGGHARATAGIGDPDGKRVAKGGANAAAGFCPVGAALGALTGHSERVVLRVTRNWYEQYQSAGSDASQAIGIHVQVISGQGMVLSGNQSLLWAATLQGPVGVFAGPLVGNHAGPDWLLTRSGLAGDHTYAGNLWRDAGRDILYANDLGSGSGDVLAWSQASGRHNHAARVLTFAGVHPVSVTGDRQHDRLFVLAQTQGAGQPLSVLVVDNASTKSGAVTPDRTLTGAADGEAIAYDPTRDILYLARGAGLALVKTASVANGAVTPVLVSGTNTAIQTRVVSLALFPDLDVLLAADFDHELIAFEKASTLKGNAACAKHQLLDRFLRAMTAWKED